MAVQVPAARRPPAPASEVAVRSFISPQSCLRSESTV